MPKAVRFDGYGGVDVLEVRDVERPVPAAGQVLVRVRAAGINPGEIGIREGQYHERWPATFPSGQGSDLAGVVDELGPGVDGLAVGDEVAGWTDERGSHAEYVAVPAEQLAPKPAGVPWEVAGSLYVAGFAGHACVRTVAPREGEVVVVSAAAGGVGVYAVQLARRTGATVVGLASEHNHGWLREHGVVPVTHGDGVEERIREAGGGRVDAFIDLFGGGYVDLALGMGVPLERINTIIDFEAVGRLGVSAEGTSQVASQALLRELLGELEAGRIDVPIEATFPLDEVRAAFSRLAERSARGKIVLLP
jgi:NADPH:quinone reductase-like Zn-dependent oxidoreductase